MKSKRYTISSFMAAEKGIPACFVAVEMVRTSRGAVYLYGHGTTDPQGRCCKCGRVLTHPGSILLGIGPECLKDWGMRDVVLEGMTPEEARRLQEEFTHKRIVDTWLPMASIKSEEEVEEEIQVPADHKMLKSPTNGSDPTPTKTAKMDQTGKFAIVQFPYEREMVDNIRRLEGRRWDPDKKVWTAWASLENLNLLKGWGFSLDEKLASICVPLKPLEEVKVTEKDLDLEGLYPFQLDGVKWLEARGGNGLLADEMGLGKTIQALGWLKLRRDLRPVVIVCPASLKLNWERETKKWLETYKGVGVLNGTVPSPLALRNINIINYDILDNWMDCIKESNPQVLIVDESHYIKNHKAQRSKAVKELAKACRHRIFLTGTPITNRPVEFFTTLNLLDPREFNSWFTYVKKYCGAKQGRFGLEVTGATNTKELHERLSGRLMLRRKKEDVLRDLPPKRRLVVPMEINNRKEYNKADVDLIRWLRDNFGTGKANKAAQAEALVRFSYLKQLAAEGMMEMAVQWIKDSLDANGKLVIFAIHYATIDKLQEELRNYNPVVLDGRKSKEEKQAAVDRFQNDPECRLFIGNIKAAGVGITLTASSNTVFVELGWTPGEHDQAEDRVHRIGQDAESVNAWYLIASNTIMEEVSEILDEKRRVMDAVLDGKDTPEDSMLKELLKKRLEG